ncbi:UNVERIFIED_CONTAM: Aspartic proteinase-like protein 2 [Sesamum radiatum]|uniref:Aspartic proteinase-like protein 2 n=1 Tax=Sesamum radiatum TaxID=300843 RepID=A0AAW2K883_SESRA
MVGGRNDEEAKRAVGEKVTTEVKCAVGERSGAAGGGTLVGRGGAGRLVLATGLGGDCLLICDVDGNVMFQVHHKYGGRGKGKATLEALRAHDSRRRGRMLAAIDFQLGGDGSPTDAALYYTKITIGTPPVDYHVQITLKQYDLTASSTGKMVSCDQDFCDAAFGRPNPDCKAGMNCEYSVTYGDGSRTEGYFQRLLQT